MWELMRIGIEMQQRMIEVHGKGLKLTQTMLHEAERKAQPATDLGDMVHKANRAQAEFVEQWLDLWGWRI